MKHLRLSSIALLVLVNCRTVYQVDADEGANHLTFSQLNSEVSEGNCVIQLSDGTEVSATHFWAQHDSAGWRLKNGDPVRLPTSDVKRVTVKNTGLGVLEGLGLGALTGLGAGILWGAVVEIPKAGKGDEGFAIILSAIFFTGAGIPIGGITGAVAGHRDHYVFMPDSTQVPMRSANY